MGDSNDNHLGDQGSPESQRERDDRRTCEIGKIVRELFSDGEHGIPLRDIYNVELIDRLRELAMHLDAENIFAFGRTKKGQIDATKVLNWLLENYHSVCRDVVNLEPDNFENGEQGKQRIIKNLSHAFVLIAGQFNETNFRGDGYFTLRQKIGRPEKDTVPPPPASLKRPQKTQVVASGVQGQVQQVSHPQPASSSQDGPMVVPDEVAHLGRDSQVGKGPWTFRVGAAKNVSAADSQKEIKTDRPSHPGKAVAFPPVRLAQPALPKDLGDLSTAAQTHRVDKTDLMSAEALLAEAQKAVAALRAPASEKVQHLSNIPVPKSSLGVHTVETTPKIVVNRQRAAVPDPRSTLETLVPGKRPGLWSRLKNWVTGVIAEPAPTRASVLSSPVQAKREDSPDVSVSGGPAAFPPPPRPAEQVQAPVLENTPLPARMPAPKPPTYRQPDSVPRPEKLEKSVKLPVTAEAKTGIFARIGNWIKRNKWAVGAVVAASGAAGSYAVHTALKSQDRSSNEAAYVQTGNTAQAGNTVTSAPSTAATTSSNSTVSSAPSAVALQTPPQNPEPPKPGTGVSTTPNAPQQAPQTLLEYNYPLGATGGAHYTGTVKISEVRGMADTTPVIMDPPTVQDIPRFQAQNSNYINYAKGLMQIYDQDPSRFTPEALAFIRSGNNAQMLHDLGSLDPQTDSNPEQFRNKFLNTHSLQDGVQSAERIQSIEDSLNHLIALMRDGDVAGGIYNLVNDNTILIGFEVGNERSVKVRGMVSSAPGTSTPGVTPQQNKGTNGGKTPGTQGFNPPGSSGVQTGFNIIRMVDPASRTWRTDLQKTFGSHTVTIVGNAPVAKRTSLLPELPKIEKRSAAEAGSKISALLAKQQALKQKAGETPVTAYASPTAAKKMLSDWNNKVVAADPIKSAEAARKKDKFNTQMRGKLDGLWGNLAARKAVDAADLQESAQVALKPKTPSVPETRIATRAEIDALLYGGLKRAA